jgi:hypothetical protein
MIEPFTAFCNLYVLHRARQTKSRMQQIARGFSMNRNSLKDYS